LNPGSYCMDKSFCERIDRESLIEEYVQGKLSGELGRQLEQHLRECERHALAVRWETNLRQGVIEFARNQLRSRIRKEYRPPENIRFVVLRYAALVLIMVVVPLMLYYQFRIYRPPGTSLKEPAPAINVIDSTAKTNARIEAKAKIQTARSTTKTQVAGEVKKTEPVTLAPEPAPEAGENVIPRESESIAPRQPALEGKPSPETSPAIIQQSAPAAKKQSADKIKEYLNTEQTMTAGGIARQADSNQTLSVYTDTGLVTPEKYNYIREQLAARQSELVNCFSAQDSSQFVVVRMTISAQGLVENLKVIESNITIQNTENCILDKIRLWKFAELHQKTVITKKIYLKS
jgi:hypothetical protein